ncbi:glycoside hydrolase family 15 protein [Rhodococcus sp. HNM0563]|uniref:glycoside hydrolase family 15 protein n=1 Tax=Rhodococcus sp. HNM0563 TaxID=2716339 RepID=UPI00146A497C|nr:glycoside hydrolase family 15 protein [Rhodococcus sp. HNM0563]NLU64247.1 glycoside hydrolase family 15 protein [Rhodococcus sp. HNM0563]
MAPHESGFGASWPPHVLREYALIADGERGALIGPRGDFAWMCAPRWDSGAVFSSLLGGPGGYLVCPATTRFTWGGHYEEGTLIWRSRWVTTTGIIECREALAFPGDPHTAVVLRRIVAVDGDAQVQVSLSADADFGAHPMHQVAHREDVRMLRAGPLHLRWTGGRGAHLRNGQLETAIELREGEHHDLVLELSDRPLREHLPNPDQLWRQTEREWHRRVPHMDGTLADRDARHACAVLTGMTSSSGGMVAAATTALPERAEQGRNYDYRYCWIRDQCYAGHAAAAAGADSLLDASVAFIAERLLDDGPQLKPAYTVGGGRVPDESTLDLPGYPGADAHLGNWVNEQFQLDSFGEALLLFAAADRVGHLGSEHWKAVEIATETIEQRWNEPDAGIWELDNAEWAHSRLTCAAGLRAISAAAPAAHSVRWDALADALVADTDTRSLHPSGRWQRAPGDDRVDAALLLPAIRGGVAADDPRTRLTLDAVRAELGREGYVYRFRHRGQPLADAEGAFLLCGFVMALAEHQQGHHVAAARWFERNRAACGSPALFTEEFDIVERQLRGNLPQAFVHALLLESAHRLAIA